MKMRRGAAAIALGCAATLALSSCGSDNQAEPSATSSPTSSAKPIAVMPTVAELNDVLARLLDPNLPADQRAMTIEDGDKAGDYFDLIGHAASEQKVRLEAVDPVLPGFAPTAVVVGVNVLKGEEPPRRVEQVDFLNKNGRWLLSQEWACRLADSVAPGVKPTYCLKPGETPPPPPADPSTSTVQPAPAPAPEVAPEQAPPPPPEGAPAPPPEGAPAPAPAPEGNPAPPPPPEGAPAPPPPPPAPEQAPPPPAA